MSSESPDTGHWVRTEADDLLRDMPEIDAATLAEELHAKAEVFDGGVELAHAIAGELRRRAAVGVRFWAAPKQVDE